MQFHAWVILWLSVLAASSTAQNCTDFSLRLTQTVTLTLTNAGRLEVCRNGIWGSIRHNTAGFWSQKNTLVACQTLGFPSALNSIPAVLLGGGPPTLPEHIEDVSCDGSETSLANCRFSNVDDGMITHIHDVYIVCLPGPITYSEVHLGVNTQEGDVRLKGSVVNGVGAVEIFTRLGWATICPDSSWTSSDARTICRNLGYESGVVVNIEVDPGLLAHRILYDAECPQTSSGSDGLLRVAAGSCSFEADSAMCPMFPNNVFAGISCRAASSRGSVRLFPGIEESGKVRGAVEVFIDSRWGGVCMPTTPETVPAICQGLGYDQRDATTIAISSESSRLKPIWYPDWICVDVSRSISECDPGSPLGYGACTEVLAIECQNDGLPLNSTILLLYIMILMSMIIM